MPMAPLQDFGTISVYLHRKIPYIQRESGEKRYKNLSPAQLGITAIVE
jgi:hypothetical protein